MIFLMFFFILILLSLTFFPLSLIFIINKKIIMIEWFIFSSMNWNLSFLLFLDWMSLLFISTVTLISSLVMIYSKEYMMFELKKKYFIIILMMFVISMMFMIISPNIFSVILGWDGLGLISYCLIIYYQNNSSFNSGMLTLLTNRIGDIMLLIMIYMMLNLSSWNLTLTPNSNLFFLTLLMIMIMTKSAQIPFSMWLPAAMAAPTPVSSLVHSSTLVTAGIYLLIRFNKILINNNLNFFVMIIGLMTMLIASLNATMEFDVKKIIALSTLSQLGLMMMMLSLNLQNYVFFHLISHAMFKSLLFLCSGIMIHFLKDSQDIRYMGNLIYETPLIITYFNFANLSLCGFPFLSGFFSKDLLYEMILNYNINITIYYLMYFCISLTMIYSFRLLFYLSFNYQMTPPLTMKVDNYTMSCSTLLLFIFTIIFGSLMNWMIFSSMNLSIVNFSMKTPIYLMMFNSMIIFILMYMINIKTSFNYYNLIFKMSNFFYLLKMTLLPSFFLIKMSKYIYYYNDLIWNEYYNKYMFMYLLKNMFNFYKKSLQNLMMTLIIMFLYTIIIISLTI